MKPRIKENTKRDYDRNCAVDRLALKKEEFHLINQAIVLGKRGGQYNSENHKK